MNLRGFADEIHLRHDAMDEEHKAVAEIFDRLRQEKRNEGLTKPEVQEFVGDFKELIRAERKYGRDLIGYEAKNERVRSLAALVYGNPSRRIEPAAPNKRTHNVPGAIEGPSENVLRACASEPIEPVASAPPRTPSDGAAVSNSPAPDTAAIKSVGSDKAPDQRPNRQGETAAQAPSSVVDEVSATASGVDPTDVIEPVVPPGYGGALPEQPRTLAGDAPILSDDGDVRGTPFDRSLWRESVGAR